MAYDKVIDSTALEAGLKEIADALREKSGWADGIRFPHDFTSLISGIETGGGDDTLDKLILREITEITSNVAKVGKHAFRDCSKLTTADFPLATSIGDYAFSGCSMLTAINLPLLSTVAQSAFSGCLGFVEIKLPSVVTVRDYGFSGCSNLDTLDLPLATWLGSYAFQNGYVLKSLILRSQKRATLNSNNALNGCYHLLGTVDTTYNPTGAKDGYIYVPRATIDGYASSSAWSRVKTQFRALEDFTVDGTITGELDPNKI